MNTNPVLGSHQRGSVLHRCIQILQEPKIIPGEAERIGIHFSSVQHKFLGSDTVTLAPEQSLQSRSG
uniref:Uncharacterized protein n=1 Tax=Arundo donax TaxID=35708 RepID=A0A0A9CKE1_ARUDO